MTEIDPGVKHLHELLEAAKLAGEAAAKFTASMRRIAEIGEQGTGTGDLQAFTDAVQRAKDNPGTAQSVEPTD